MNAPINEIVILQTLTSQINVTLAKPDFINILQLHFDNIASFHSKLIMGSFNIKTPFPLF